MRALSSALLALSLLCFAFPANSQDKPEITKVRLAVGGKPALFYLPLTVTERLGYFKSEGLDVEISDFQGGGRALQALIGGSADVVTGSYDHTIQMQAKNQPIVAVVQLGRLPGYVIGVLASKAHAWRGPQDLKGMKIGITAPGSSTQFMVQYLMARHDLKPDDASFIAVGTGPSAIAAARSTRSSMSIRSSRCWRTSVSSGWLPTRERLTARVRCSVGRIPRPCSTRPRLSSRRTRALRRRW